MWTHGIFHTLFIVLFCNFSLSVPWLSESLYIYWGNFIDYSDLFHSAQAKAYRHLLCNELNLVTVKLEVQPAYFDFKVSYSWISIGALFLSLSVSPANGCLVQYKFVFLHYFLYTVGRFATFISWLGHSIVLYLQQWFYWTQFDSPGKYLLYLQGSFSPSSWMHVACNMLSIDH